MAHRGYVMRRVCQRALGAGAVVLISLIAEAEERQITEKGTGKPVAGAFVIGQWLGQAPNPVDAATICLHAEIRLSDEQGRFRISSTSGNFNPLITNRRRIVGVYKPGYQLSEESREEDLTYIMEPAIGTPGERFAQVARNRAPFRCELADKELLPFLKARAAELSSLARTSEEQHQLSNTLFTVERIEFGEAEAMKRLAEREKARRRIVQEGK